MRIELIEKFKNRQIKAKNLFTICEISKNDAYDFIRQYHYLGDAKFFCMYGYGLFCDNELVGCATYSCVQGGVALKGWFGLSNDDTSVLELSRLCMLPSLNGTNATSYLLGNSMKMLKQHDIRAVVTLADSNRHIGSIYQVCNFKYYGLTDSKTDFFTNNSEGKLLNNPRMKTKDAHGVWLPRTRKHRYCYILDKELKPLYDEQPHPTSKYTIDNDCCYHNMIVYDNRFNEWWTCPRCIKKLEQLEFVPKIIVTDDMKLIKNFYKCYDYDYVINLNNCNKKNVQAILKNCEFDCFLMDKESQDFISKYKNNMVKCVCRDFRYEDFCFWQNKEYNGIENYTLRSVI